MELIGATWLVTGLEDGSGTLGRLLDGTTLTLGYDGERVSGTAGCNRYFGPASLGDDVRIGPLGSTMMFCAAPEGVMEQERRFLDLVSAADSLLLGEGQMELRAGGRTTIVFEPLSPQLSGTWTLLFYNDSTALVSPIIGSKITAEFTEGRIQGSSGCNRYTASFETTGSSLLITAPASTRRMCSGPAGVMEQEARYLHLLSVTASYQWADDRILEIFDAEGERTLQFTRG